jgi:hypothetical protein
MGALSYEEVIESLVDLDGAGLTEADGAAADGF